MQGKYVPLADTFLGFRDILDGKYDHIPESMFLYAGGIEEVVQRYENEK